MKCKCIKDCKNPLEDVIEYKEGRIYNYAAVNMKNVDYWRVGTDDLMYWYYRMDEVKEHFIDISEYRDEKIGDILNG